MRNLVKFRFSKINSITYKFKNVKKNIKKESKIVIVIISYKKFFNTCFKQTLFTDVGPSEIHRRQLLPV